MSVDVNDIRRMLEQIRSSSSFESANLSREVATNVQNFLGASIHHAAGSSHLLNVANTIHHQLEGDTKQLLEQLGEQMQQLQESLPPEARDEVDDDFSMLVKQATSPKPNRKWYTVSAEGLLEASKGVKDLTGNMAGTVAQLGKQLWPDFTLPPDTGK